MHICLASIHPRALSGQIEGLAALARELERSGHKVTLVSAFGEELRRQDRLALAERDSESLFGKLGRIGSILAGLARQARSADLVHINLPTPAFSILGDLLQQCLSVPVVVGFEAHLADGRRLRQSGDLWASPQFYLPRMLVNNGLLARCGWHGADRYIVSSHCQAAELLRLRFPPARVSVLPNLVDMDKLQRIDQSEARRQLGLPEGRLVGYVGHYNPVKGVDTLIRAFEYVSQHFDDCRLVLAWSGIGDPGPIERAISDTGVGHRVLHLGRAPIGALLSALDVLALPYRLTMGQNAYPGLLLEALGVGVPLVTSDLPLLREVVEHERTALLVPPGDAVATATAISALLENRDLGSRMAAEQRWLLRGPFSPPQLAKQYVQLYRHVCSGEAPARTPFSAPDVVVLRASRQIDSADEHPLVSSARPRSGPTPPSGRPGSSG